MKKVICLALSVLLLLSLTACTPESTPDQTVLPTETPAATPAPTPVKISDYQHYEVENGVPKDKFNVTYFFGPNNKELTEDVVKLIAECGITSVPLDLDWETYVKDGLQSVTDAVKLLAKYGLICSNLMTPFWSVRCTPEEFNEEAFENAAKAMLDAVKDCDNVKSLHLCDEPAEEWFPSLAKANEILQRLAPEKDSFINLGPSWGCLTTKEYEELLEKYIELVKPSYLSYDNYCLKKPIEYEEGPNGFFTNIELIRKVALKHDLPYENIILLSEHYSYPNLTRAQISWEVSNSLVYGVKGISYFTFSLSKELMEEEGYTNACINYKGEIYPHYYDVQAVNSWALPLGTELFNKTSTAVFHTQNPCLELECTEYTGYGKLGKITPLNGEFVIGFFDDDSFMITNKDYDSDARKNSVILNDFTADRKLEYFDTTTATWRPASECENITFTLSDTPYYVLHINQGSFIYLRAAE